MSPGKPTLAFIAIVLAASVAPGAEAVWPNNSASDLSIFVTLQRFQIYADHCSVKVPELKPQFDGLIDRLFGRMQGISKGLLSSDRFRDMKGQPVPPAISFALKDSLDDAKHNFERQDADAICPKTLRRLGEMDDDSLKSDLTQTLVAVQTMTRNLGKEGAPEAPPERRPVADAER